MDHCSSCGIECWEIEEDVMLDLLVDGEQQFRFKTNICFDCQRKSNLKQMAVRITPVGVVREVEENL